MRTFRVLALVAAGTLFLSTVFLARGPTIRPAWTPAGVVLEVGLAACWAGPLGLLVAAARTSFVVVVGSLAYVAAETLFLRSMYSSSSSTVGIAFFTTPGLLLLGVVGCLSIDALIARTLHHRPGNAVR